MVLHIQQHWMQSEFCVSDHLSGIHHVGSESV